MKRLLLAVSAVFIFLSSFSQAPSLSREVISSAGDYFISPVGSLSWTLGEPVIETVENGSINIILTQGFQQPDELPVGIWQIPADNIFVNLYPNPTVQIVRLDLKYDANSKMKIELVDMLGRVLHTDKLNVTKGQVSNYELDVSSLAAGMYMFRLTGNGRLLNSYKFQKVSN